MGSRAPPPLTVDTAIFEMSLRRLSTHQQHEVASGVLAGAEDGVDRRAGGVVHGQEQGEFGSPVLKPGVMAAVQLHQHPSLGHPLAAETVLW